MRLIIQFFYLFNLCLSLSVLLNLLGYETQVGHVIFLFQDLVVNSYDVLLFLGPAELLSFKFSDVLDFLALFLESLVGLVVNFL